MEKIEKGQRKGRRVGCCERSKRVECAGESGRTAYHHYRSLPLLVSSLLSFSVSRLVLCLLLANARFPEATSLCCLFSLSLSLSFSSPSRSPVRPIPRPLSISLSPDPWRFSREPGRGAASRAREMPVIRRDFDYAHYESFSPYETRGDRVLRLMLVPLPSAIRVDPRRDALRLEYASYTYAYTHIYKRAHTNRLLPTLASYVHHADTLAYTTSAATIAALLFFFLLFFVFLPPISSLLLPLPRLILLYHYIYSITTSFSFKSFFLYCLCLFIFLLFFYYSL